jgi:hypothetical protein
MCLTISVELPMMPKQEVVRLASQGSSSEGLEIHFEGTVSFFGRGNRRLTISEAGEGCACSMLTDDADWNAPTWDIQPTLLMPLTNSLAYISERAANGLILEALWAGDEPEKNLELSSGELLSTVRENRVGTKTRYIVRAT